MSSATGEAKLMERVGFVGIRTEKFSDMVRLLRDVMGAQVTREEDTVVGFRMADGTTVEIYSTEDDFHSFFTTGPVVGFEVDDFDEVRRRMLETGIQFIGDPQHDSGVSWQHFRNPDGTVCEIIGPGAPLALAAPENEDADQPGD
ncbi:VOC family protein [Streptomyces sp. NPDC051909]|uniref:VOC family protein n=1 Tax=Streptomyces sp. NPDC051909 TaxID=3154944 RepID=UPI00341317D7